MCLLYSFNQIYYEHYYQKQPISKDMYNNTFIIYNVLKSKNIIIKFIVILANLNFH